MNSLRHMSFATRLGLLFAAVTVLTFSGASVHLYQSLSQQLQWRDDVALMSVIDLLRHQLEEYNGIDEVRADPHRLLDVALGHKGVLLTLKDSKGVVLIASAPEAKLLPVDFAVAADHVPDTIAIRDWHGSDGEHGRMIAAWGKVGRRPENQVLLVVAREKLERVAIIRAHREDLLWTVLVGALVAALLGYAIARRGLRPIQAVARTADEITAHQFGERLRIEDAPAELEDLIRTFNRMLDRLEDSFRRLTQFSSDIAHELRTPISNLMVETQVTLTQQRQVPEYEALLVSNIEEYERLTSMIEKMLFLAHADNAQVALHRDVISVDQELKRIAEYFEGAADEAGVALDVNASGNVVVDSMLFRRAVSNLVANAIRYTPRGRRIAIRGYLQGGGGFVIEVSNPGDGIPPEHLSRIFDRFYRVDISRGKSESSFGLGLAIVKSIMTLHNGEVHVESGPNGFTTFRLVFPAD